MIKVVGLSAKFCSNLQEEMMKVQAVLDKYVCEVCDMKLKSLIHPRLPLQRAEAHEEAAPSSPGQVT